MAYEVSQLLGISQAELDALFTASEPGPIPEGQADGTAIIATGTTTDRPLLDPGASGAADLPAAEEDPSRLDLGRNGSYLVFRELHQDVRGFWRFLEGQTDSPEEARRLAEAMVDRRMSGEPLIAGTRRIRGVSERNHAISQNGFTYDDAQEAFG